MNTTMMPKIPSIPIECPYMKQDSKIAKAGKKRKTTFNTDQHLAQSQTKQIYPSTNRNTSNEPVDNLNNLDI